MLGLELLYTVYKYITILCVCSSARVGVVTGLGHISHHPGRVGGLCWGGVVLRLSLDEEKDSRYVCEMSSMCTCGWGSLPGPVFDCKVPRARLCESTTPLPSRLIASAHLVLSALYSPRWRDMCGHSFSPLTTHRISIELERTGIFRWE